MSQPRKHVWQFSIHDAMEWCKCGEMRPTMTEDEMEAGLADTWTPSWSNPGWNSSSRQEER